MPERTVHLKDYRPPAFEITKINLEFDLYDDHAMVKNCMQIKRQSLGALRLNGDGLELISIWLNDIELNAFGYRMIDGDLYLDDCPDEFSITIITRLRPQDNTQLSGLYRSRQLFCTQCEAEGFRRITYFPDRPDVLSTFTTKITADKEA